MIEAEDQEALNFIQKLANLDPKDVAELNLWTLRQTLRRVDCYVRAAMRGRDGALGKALDAIGEARELSGDSNPFDPTPMAQKFEARRKEKQ